MSNTVIKVENLCKYYRLGLIGGGTLREDVNRWMAKLQGKPDPLLKVGEAGRSARRGDMIWALRDVNFEVQQGEILGIVGRNGAGKSTLLKILSRITAPTEGRVTIKGRVGSLLEVGTGFHPELTGRENIYLNGTILGMKKAEVDRKLEEIVDFAEMGRFVDTPAKRYSSGMTVRLAFAVAAHLEPEILVVDEVLAVGDADFQKKCIGKMRDVAGGGRTVLFVTHNMGTALELCDRGMLIKEGGVAFEGDMEGTVREYLGSGQGSSTELSKKHFTGHLLDEVEIRSSTINGQPLGQPILIRPDEDVVIEFVGVSKLDIKNFNLFATVHTQGIRVATLYDSEPGTALLKAGFRSRVSIPRKTLRPGNYTVGIGGERAGGFQWFIGHNLGEFTILEDWSVDYRGRDMGVVNIPLTGEREVLGDVQ